MSHIEFLLTKQMQTKFGWSKLNGISRIIRIGNTRNCNDDGLIYSPTVKNRIEEFLKKYNINDYVLNNIQTEYEYSYELILPENIYNELSNKINTNTNNVTKIETIQATC
jgi:hypothetical protein